VFLRSTEERTKMYQRGVITARTDHTKEASN
jgi:hypothetical protein